MSGGLVKLVLGGALGLTATEAVKIGILRARGTVFSPGEIRRRLVSTAIQGGFTGAAFHAGEMAGKRALKTQLLHPFSRQHHDLGILTPLTTGFAAAHASDLAFMAAERQMVRAAQAVRNKIAPAAKRVAGDAIRKTRDRSAAVRKQWQTLRQQGRAPGRTKAGPRTNKLSMPRLPRAPALPRPPSLTRTGFGPFRRPAGAARGTRSKI